jgi:ABC-type multidrug transport system fused ATPase/permease subunit
LVWTFQGKEFGCWRCCARKSHFDCLLSRPRIFIIILFVLFLFLFLFLFLVMSPVTRLVHEFCLVQRSCDFVLISWISFQHNTQTNTHNKTWALPETAGGKDEPITLRHETNRVQLSMMFNIHVAYFICYVCLFAYYVVQHILCCVFVLFSFVLCTLCCQFLWNVNFWLPLRYSLTFIKHYWKLHTFCFMS